MGRKCATDSPIEHLNQCGVYDPINSVVVVSDIQSMNSSFYTRLFTYLERIRSPREDFLTEALADPLNQMPSAEMEAIVETHFLGSPNASAAWKCYREANLTMAEP
jgi:hypothetical protein